MRTFMISAIAAMLVSCSGETNYENIIENKTGKEIKILLYNSGVPRGDTLVLTPSSSRVISRGSSNQADEEEPDCAETIDSAWTEVIGGGMLSKDISKDRNWDVVTEQTRNVPREFEHTCTFTIRESDILE